MLERGGTRCTSTLPGGDTGTAGDAVSATAGLRRQSRLRREASGFGRVHSVSRAEILNAFSPAKELTDPQRFAGRKSQIVSLTDALRVHGSVLVVYGERGLGKSSTAAQIQLIALGDEELLRSLGTPDLSLPEDETFLTFYVTCTDRVESLDDLLKLILHRLQAVDLVAVTALDAEQLVDRQTRRKISFKIFEQETTRRYESRTSRVRVESLSIEEQLERELALLIEAFNLPC